MNYMWVIWRKLMDLDAVLSMFSERELAFSNREIDIDCARVTSGKIVLHNDTHTRQTQRQFHDPVNKELDRQCEEKKDGYN